MPTKRDGRASNGGARPNTGPQPKRATAEAGNWISVNQVLPDGGYVSHGRGEVVEIKKAPSGRVIVVKMMDGSTFNLMVIK